MSVRSESSSVTTVALEELIVYPKRWVVLGIFSLMTFANQALWVTFVPISDVAAEYLSATTTQVNWLSIVWLVLYLPGTYIQALILEKYDLRTVVVFGGFLTLLGATLRVFASVLNLYVGIGDNWRYGLQLLGSAIAGLVQPIFLNLPGNISSAWFGPGERDVSTTLASVCGPVGCAIGSILPSAFVSLDMTDRVMDRNFLNLFLCELAMCAVGFLPLYQYFESRPPTPPSESERMRQKLLENEKERASSDPGGDYNPQYPHPGVNDSDRGSIGLGGSGGDDSAVLRGGGGVWSPPPVRIMLLYYCSSFFVFLFVC
jgi:FLVCR family feline leukemia virus subgroup C receptor-related protein